MTAGGWWRAVCALQRRVVLILWVTVPAAGCATQRGATSQDAELLRIVSYNIRHGRGMDDRVDLQRTAGVLRALAPDVIGLQEVDDSVARSGHALEAAVLGSALNMEHRFGAFMPYQGGRYGMAILSRFPIIGQRSIRLPDGNEPRIALEATLRMPTGDTIHVINVHFDWVADDAFRYAQATRLSAALDSLTHPYVLLGDFNDEPGSRTLRLFGERAQQVAKDRGAHFTFSSREPVKEIDFVFVAPAGRWTLDGARAIAERDASDHRPVLATVALRRR